MYFPRHFVVVSALVLCWAATDTVATTPHPVDKQEMILLLQASRGWPSFWNISDIDNMCDTWSSSANFINTFLTCNEAGRITEFVYNPRDIANYPPLQGSIPSSFFSLPSFERFMLPRISRMNGTIPASLFTKENISEIQIWSSAQTVILPQTLAPTMRVLRIGGVEAIGAPRETWNSTVLTAIELEDLDFECPLPTWFVNQVINDGFPDGCQLTQSNLFVRNNSICGQIPADKMKCWMFPTATTNVVDAAKRAGTQLGTQYQHRFGNAHVEVHLNGTSMFIFGATVVGTRRYVYYEEWVGMEFQGWQQRGSDDADNAVLALRWGSTLKETEPGKTFETELILVDGTIMNMTFYLEHPQAPEGVKFSFDVLKPNSFDISSGQPKMALAMNPIIRQHLLGTRPIVCNLTSILTPGGFRCSSDIANMTIELSPVPGVCFSTGKVNFESTKLRIGLSLQACYLRDGQDAFVTDLDLSPFLPGIGSLRAFSRRYFLNPNTPYANIAAADQYVVLPFSAGFDKFNNLSWDPDITISLLFDPVFEPDASPVVGPRIDNDVTAIAIAVPIAIIVAVLAIVFLTDLKYKWLPFRRRNEDLKEASPEPIDEEFSPPQENRQQNGRWSEGSRSRASLRNV